MPQYKVAETIESSHPNALAGDYSDAAGEANRRADNYMLAVVLFATALFFAGISTKLGSLHQRKVILALGYTTFVSTLIWIATSPIALSA